MRSNRRVRFGTVSLVAGFGALALAFVAPAFACSGISTLTVTPALAAPGEELRVVAEGVGPVDAGQQAKPVEIFWVGEGGKGRQLLGTAQPSAEGRLDATVNAPAGAALGSYLVKIRPVGAEEDREANALVKMVDAPLANADEASQPGTSARPLGTAGGFDVRSSSSRLLVMVPLGLVGLALVGAGALVLARQPRQD